ncbi:MAG: alpha/beta hydrolase, partial [Bacteroidota bacterium]|nr:alpha/beta hydrolase [Bacteroidota bacterium]
MDRKLHLPLSAAALLFSPLLFAQERYVEEVFTNDQIEISNNVIYGTNIDFLTSNFSSPNVSANVIELQTAVSSGTPIPEPYFDPANTSTAVKVKNLEMDIYRPNADDDDVEDRPLVIYVHTGNALPPPLNGSPNGTRKDSSAVEICKRMARRGYVAASISYRLGWNPLASSEEERRGSLLNAIYRAIHDVRQSVRFLKASADGANTYGICPSRIIVIGEGTGGYISLANATLDDP